MSKTDNYLDSQGWVIDAVSNALNKCTSKTKAKMYRKHLKRLIKIREFISEHTKELEVKI